ncbi:protein kinase [Myxococcota bacterium]
MDPARLLQSGDTVAGKYQIEHVLGSGGVGVVVAAQHLQLGERVALKFMHREALRTPTDMARFLQEARAAVRLKSEHIARVIDVGTREDGSPFIVMEYLTGTDLADALEQGGPIPVSDAVDYVLQACEALAEAHSLGIVHRDLKPSNLFLTERPDGSPLVKVLDFGIAKASIDLELGGGEGRLTRTRTVLGSPIYMAPEQVRDTKSVDQRSDIWSLGVVLYELVSGAVPFEGDTATGVVAAVLSDPPTPLLTRRGDLPQALAYAVERCLQKEREHRFQNVAELAEVLMPLAPESSRPLVERIAGTLGLRGRIQTALSRVSQLPTATATTIRSAEVVLGDSKTKSPTVTWLAAGTALAGLIALGILGLGIHRNMTARAAATGIQLPALSATGTIGTERAEESPLASFEPAITAVESAEPSTSAALPPARVRSSEQAKPERIPRQLARSRAPVRAPIRAPAGDVVDRAFDSALPAQANAARALVASAVVASDPAPPRRRKESLIDETVDTRK